MERLHHKEVYKKEITRLANAYYKKHFPKASKAELSREISDWITKIDKSQGVVKDFTRMICDPRGMRILDCGSGSGGLSVAFAEAGVHMTGVDIESELVRIAGQNLRAYSEKFHPEFVLYDGTRLPFADESFDAALSVSVLEHVDDPVRYLGEIGRVLKPEGKLFLAFPNRLMVRETHTGVYGLSYLPRPVASVVAKMMRRNPIEANNLHFYSYFALKRFLQTLGRKGIHFHIVDDKGTHKSGARQVIKRLFASCGLSYKLLLPHIIVVLEKTA